MYDALPNRKGDLHERSPLVRPRRFVTGTVADDRRFCFDLCGEALSIPYLYARSHHIYASRCRRPRLPVRWTLSAFHRMFAKST